MRRWIFSTPLIIQRSFFISFLHSFNLFLLSLFADMHFSFILSSILTLTSWVKAAPATSNSNLSKRCTNSATDRSCWGDYDLSSNYYDEAPDTGVVVEYWFELVNSTLAPDGVERITLTVNGTFPGPTIIANWGDTVSKWFDAFLWSIYAYIHSGVHVYNGLENNGTRFVLLRSPETHGLNSFLSDTNLGPKQSSFPRYSSKLHKPKRWCGVNYSMPYGAWRLNYLRESDSISIALPVAFSWKISSTSTCFPTYVSILSVHRGWLTLGMARCSIWYVARTFLFCTS